MLEALDKIETGDIVAINWIDASLRSRVELDALIMPRDMLVDSMSFGLVKCRDLTAITIVQNYNENTMDILTIPIADIIGIEIYNNNMKGGIKNDRRKNKKDNR